MDPADITRIRLSPKLKFAVYSLLIHGILFAGVFLFSKRGPKVSLNSSEILIEMVRPGAVHHTPAHPHRPKTPQAPAQVVDLAEKAEVTPPLPVVSEAAAPNLLPHDGAPTQSPAPAETLTHPVGEMAVYISEIFKKIEAIKVYPKSAMLREESGLVVVCLTIRPDGFIEDSHIEAPSAFASLNEAALEILKKLGTLPPLPAGTLRPIRVKVPIRYELK